eukprot:8566416-Pyramimonas_sp.AAC.2
MPPPLACDASRAKGERSGRKWGTGQGGEKRGGVRRLAGSLADERRMFAEERRQLLATAEHLRTQA